MLLHESQEAVVRVVEVVESVVTIRNPKVCGFENRQSWVRSRQLLEAVKGFWNFGRRGQGFSLEQENVIGKRTVWIACLKFLHGTIDVVESMLFDKFTDEPDMGLLPKFVVRMERQKPLESSGRFFGTPQ